MGTIWSSQRSTYDTTPYLVFPLSSFDCYKNWTASFYSWPELIFVPLDFSLPSHIVCQVWTMCVCNQWMASCPSSTRRPPPSPAFSQASSSPAPCNTSPGQTHSSPPTRHVCCRHSGEYSSGWCQAAVTVSLFPYMVGTRVCLWPLAVAKMRGRCSRLEERRLQ